MNFIAATVYSFSPFFFSTKYGALSSILFHIFGFWLSALIVIGVSKRCFQQS